MPLYKFNSEDLFYNRVKAYPRKSFFIYDSKVYIDGIKTSKSLLSNELATTQGYLSLYELNIDRVIDQSTSEPPGSGSIFPFVTKNGARTAFKTISTSEFDSANQFNYGDIIKSNYPLTASITRTRFAVGPPTASITDRFVQGEVTQVANSKKNILALKNVFNSYSNISKHYLFSSSSVEAAPPDVNWDKGRQLLNLIEIPSIFYGSSIRKGSVSLKFYITGALAAEITDKKKNGELIQVSGTAGSSTAYNDKVAGVVLYNEGFIALTGSWNINADFQDKYTGGAFSTPKWTDFGAGAFDGTAAGVVTGSAFVLEYQGVNYIPTVTMMAHAGRGKLNNSTNPTVTRFDQSKTPQTSSQHFKEFDDLEFVNLNNSQYVDPTGSYKKEVYISKIGVYDKDRNLIGIAKLAKPVRKTEEREYTFKLKLDF